MNNKYDPVYNAKELQAWHEWKRICAVCGCGEEEQQLLKRALRSGFREAYKRSKLRNSFEIPKETCEELIHEFDIQIIEREFCPGIDRRTGKPRQKKKYKNYYWELLEKSSDDPLKVLRGMLVGPKGLVNDIMNNYLRSNGIYFTASASEYGKKHVQAISIHEALSGGEENDLTLEKTLAADILPRKLNEDDQAELQQRVEQDFTLQELALILAKTHKISVDNEHLKCAVQLKKTRANEIQEIALGKLGKVLIQFDEEEDKLDAIGYMKSCAIKRLRAEKQYSGFLSKIEEAESRNSR